jgi:hypothetical protein
MKGNKRSTNRAMCRLAVRYGTDTCDRIGFTRDVSEGGMHIQGGRSLAQGTVIQIAVQLRQETVALQGRVAWAKQPPPTLAHLVKGGMGIELIDPPDAWREIVTAWREGKVLAETSSGPGGPAKPRSVPPVATPGRP